MNKVNEIQEKVIEKFKDYPLDNAIKRALSELGFKQPLEVQAKVIPMIWEGKDLIVKSQTGSGKTAAFAIPLCEKIDVELDTPQVLVLTPTRELTEQVKQDIADIGKYKGVKCCALYGRQPMELQRKELKQTLPHVIVATPGRMMDHLLNKNVKLHDIKYLVIDEADEMLIMGFKEQLETIIKKIPKERVTLLFSATIPNEVHFLSQEFMNHPEEIQIEAEVSNLEKIEQIYYAVDGLKKVDFMKKVIERERPRKAIIFCNTQEQVANLFEIFRKWDHFTCAVHGGMDQQMRTETLNAFKRGEYKMLIATDVAARGLHVQGITHVINYGVPFEHEQYVHRIGRTGRVDQHGIAITMVIPSEMDRFHDLEKFLGYTIPCKGGHVDRKPPKADSTRRTGRERYKADNRRGQKAFVQFNAGRDNSSLKTSDFLAAIRRVDGIRNEDIGKVDIRGKVTNVEISDGKEALVIKAFKTKTIKGKLYRVKKG
ncbi:DEAD/DEAH box helicase [Aminipila butyrica]|uniref:DEAD/DEAH box helicase n=1 Tax=Aminipila butyrica TaxID=433296 RepID=A0A858BW55_9FIRM|nr:DEAD/DEAH box helicase [Aminipila butyrica]QIB69305.1 DEAD/DEAH box helicase [Aminipila butyrica]